MKVTRWQEDHLPDKDYLLNQLMKEGLQPFIWYDAVGTYYPVHTHPYTEIRWVLTGSITFGVNNESITLSPGDRLDLPSNTPHDAQMSYKTMTSYVCATIQS